MLAYRTSGAIVAAFTVLALASVPAVAAKKMTYEQAYEKCKQELAGKVQPQVQSAVSGTTVGAGCMKKYGYRLKK